MKIRQVGAELFCENGRTDGQTLRDNSQFIASFGMRLKSEKIYTVFLRANL